MFDPFGRLGNVSKKLFSTFHLIQRNREFSHKPTFKDYAEPPQTMAISVYGYLHENPAS